MEDTKARDMTASTDQAASLEKGTTQISKEKLRAKFFPEDGSSSEERHLTKTEFQLLALDVLAIRVPQSVIDSIFSNCDQDGSGTITCDEIVEYMDKIDDPVDPKDKERIASIKRNAAWSSIVSAFTSTGYWINNLLLGGCILSLINNFGGRTRDMPRYFSLLVFWMVAVGATYYLVNWSYVRQMDLYKLSLSAKRVLQQVVRNSSLFDDDVGKGEKSGLDPLTQKFVDDDGLDKNELNQVLEGEGVSLPRHLLASIFKEMDADNSGVVSKHELKEFMEKQNVDPSPSQVQAEVMKRVVMASDFHSNWTWVVGMGLYIIAGHIDLAGSDVGPNTTARLYGAGGVFLLLCGMALMINPYVEVTRELESISQLRAALTQHGDNHADIFSKLDAQGKDEGDGDGELDDAELYQALISSGILIPNETFLKLFRQADVSGDGMLQMDEFVTFLKSTKKPETYSGAWWCLVIRMLPFAPSSDIVFLLVLAGTGCVLSSYAPISSVALNCLAMAVICYALLSVKTFIMTPYNGYLHNVGLKKAESNFKKQLIQATAA